MLSPLRRLTLRPLIGGHRRAVDLPVVPRPETLGAKRLAPLLAAVLLTVLACGRSAVEIPVVEPPRPALDNLEPPVVAAIEAAHDRLLDQPRHAPAWGNYGIVLQAHDFYSEAVVSYHQAAALAPNDERWPYLTALALRTTAPQDAIASFERAEALHPQHGAFFVRFADTLLTTGDSQAAKGRYQKALEIEANSAFAHFGLARVALVEDDPATARDHLQRALAQASGFREAHTLMAQVQQRLGDSDGARLATWKASNIAQSSAPADPIFEQVAAAGRSSVWAVRRGLAAVGAERFPEAVDAFRQALAIRGDNAVDLAYLGGALAASQQLDAAMEAYTKALQLDPQSVLVRNNLAQALMQQGELDAAAEHLEVALEVDPVNRDALLNLGIVRGRQRRVEASRRHLEAALDIAPGDVGVLRLLAPLLLQLGATDSALELWRRQLAIEPQSLETLEQVVRLEVQRGEHGEAIARLRRGLEVAPNSSRLVLFLAWNLATAPDVDLRDGSEAVRLASRVRQAYPQQYQPADVLAAAHAENGDFERAMNEARVALELAAAAEAPVLEDLEARLDGYRQGQPYRQ